MLDCVLCDCCVAMLALDARVCLVRSFDAVLSITSRILNLAPGVLHLAFYLLNGAFNLRLGIAGQISYLALRAPNNIVDRAHNSVLVHVFTLLISSCS